MGGHFTDMTADATYDQQTNPFGNGMHPDQHAMAFVPGTDIGFFGSDGGVVRTSGQFANISSHCPDFPNRGSFDDAHNFAYGPMQG